MKTTNNDKTRIISGVRPTGHIHLGNFLWRSS